MTTSAQVVETSVTTTDNSPFLGLHSPGLHYYKPWSYESMTVDIWKSYKLGIAQLIGSNPARPEIFPTLFSLLLKKCSMLRRLLSYLFLNSQFTYKIFIYPQSFLFCSQESKLLWPKTKSKVTIPFTKYSETNPRSLLHHGKCANLGTLSRTRRMPWFTAVRFMWSVWPLP